MKFDIFIERVLEMLAKEAPRMELRKAYDFIEKYQSARNDLRKYEFIIMMFLDVLGINHNGSIKDKETAKKLENLSDNFWLALQEAIHIHAGYVCSPFTPSNWTEIIKKELNIELNKSFKNSQLSIIK